MRARCDDKEGGEMCVKAPLTVSLCRVLHHYRRRQGKLVRVCNVQSLRLRSCPISHPSLVLFLSRLNVLSAIDLLQYSFSIRRQLSLVRTAWQVILLSLSRLPVAGGENTPDSFLILRWRRGEGFSPVSSDLAVGEDCPGQGGRQGGH